MSLPLYLEISERLTREITAGIIPDGARLPPEAAMARQLGVATGTLRKALAELQSRGLLLRRQGSGNYVRRTDGPVGIYAFFHLELPAGGGLPTARNLALDRLPGPLGPDPRPRLRRLRLLDARPVAIEEIWIASAAAFDAPPESLYRFYAAELGLPVTRVEDRLATAPVPPWTPPDFPLAEGAPAGHVSRRATARDGRTAELSQTWFDPAQAHYVARWHEGPA